MNRQNKEKLSLFSILSVFIDYYDAYRLLTSTEKNLVENMWEKIKEAWDPFNFSLFTLGRDYEEKKYLFDNYEKSILARGYLVCSVLSNESKLLHKSFNLFLTVGNHYRCRKVLELLRNMNPNDPKLNELEREFSKLVIKRSRFSQNISELLHAINPLIGYLSLYKEAKGEQQLQTQILNLYWEETWEYIIQIYEDKKQDILNSQFKIQLLEIIYKAYLKMSKEKEANEVKSILELQRLNDVKEKLIRLFRYLETRGDAEAQEWVISCLERIGVENEVISDFRERVISLESV